jgi:hypothetical protein
MRIRGGFVIVAAVAVLLAGCGSSGPTVGPDGPALSAGATTAAGAGATPRGSVALPAEPCSLLTAEDLKGQFKVDFPPAEVGSFDETRTDCFWDPALLDASAAMGPVRMTVMAVREDLWDSGREQAGVTLVPGVGDDAYFSPLARGALESRVGDVHLRFSVELTGGSQADTEASLVALAKLAISRL